MERKQFEDFLERRYRWESRAEPACYVLSIGFGIAAALCLLLLPDHKPVAWYCLGAAVVSFFCGVFSPLAPIRLLGYVLLFIAMS